MKKGGILVVILLVVVLYFFNKHPVTLRPSENFELGKMGGGYELKSTLLLHNPNLLSSTIENIYQEYRINGTGAGTLQTEIRQGIPGRKETTFPVGIRFGGEVLENMPPGDSLPLLVMTRISFSNFIGGGNIEDTQTYFIRYKP